MGMCGSTTTQTTTLAPLDPEGESYDALLKQIMLANLQEFGGYDVTPTDKVKYQDENLPFKASQILPKLQSIDSQIAQLQAQGATGGLSTGGKYGGAVGGTSQSSQQLAALQQERKVWQDRLDGIPQTTYTDYQLTKQEDPRVLDAIKKYGEGSVQVQQMREQINQDKIESVQLNSDITKKYLQNSLKLANGDFSYTPEQAAQIDKYIAPVKDLIVSTTQDLLDTYGESDQSMRTALEAIAKQIDQTGYDVGSALDAASVQYEKSGATLMDTLKKVNESSYAKAKFEFDLLSQQADQKAAQQSALLGLPPGSQSEKTAAMKMKTDALKQIELDLAQQEAQGSLNIQSGVETGKQQISLSKAALAQSQGEAKQGVAQQGFGLTKLLSDKIESAKGNKANALINLEQGRQSMLENAAFGFLPQALSAGANAQTLERALKTGDYNTIASLMGPIAQQLGVHQNEQVAQATTTTKQKKGFLDVFTDILGAGASAAGAAFGIGGFGGGGGGGGAAPSSGGSGVAAIAPFSGNLNVYSPQPSFNLGNYGNQLGF